MKKVELLSPVGNKESLVMAVMNGADAVYFAGKNYGARKYADNFNDEELKEAVEYAHLYGVKVNVTVNILLFDDEIDDALEYIKYLYEIGVDALIMQDFGLIKLVREMYPNMDIHASTQCHNHNEDGINFMEELGVKRIVLDRELSLSEIKNINTNLEKEVFVHGALCISYSGCCLFSSMNGGRSGNRGECVASCRTPFDLLKNGNKVDTEGRYILSTKELNTLNNIDKLIDAGIDCFKIEGRMKSPEYVGFVTRLYRMMIDSYYNGTFKEIDEEYIYNLKKLFNREFTSGYLFGNHGKTLMNIKTPNHQGVVIGKIISYNDKFLKVKLDDEVSQGDAIRLPGDNGMYLNRIYSEKELLINGAKAGEVILIDNKFNINKKGDVKKTIDVRLIDEIKSSSIKKIPIDIKVQALVGEQLIISLNDGVNTVSRYGIVVDTARKSPTTKEDIIKQVDRLIDTPFKMNSIDISISDNPFIPVSKINELRREAVEELISIRKKVTRNFVVNQCKKDKDHFNYSKKNINVLVRNEEQLNTILSLDINNIYTEDYKLYSKYKDKCNIYLRLPRVNIKNKDYSNERLLVTELGGLSKYSDTNEVIVDYTMNCTNQNTYMLCKNKGAKLVTLSVEIPYTNLKDNDNKYYSGEFYTYGRVELMIMKYCPLNMVINKDNINCSVCLHNDKYSLKDKNGNIYPIKNTLHYTHIYHKAAVNNINRIGLAKKLGISNYRVDLFDEDKEEIIDIINSIREELGE